MMKVLISGYCGHMGQILAKMVREDNDLTLVAGVDKSISDNKINCSEPVFASFSEVNIDVDIVVDFSHHSLTKDLIDFAKSKNLPLVIATTGQSEDEKSLINEASKSIPVFFAANYSIGIAVLIKEAKNIAKIMKDADIEIIETHHNRKLDAPSGTALKIAEGLKEVRTDSNLVLGRSGNKKREKNNLLINNYI